MSDRLKQIDQNLTISIPGNHQNIFAIERFSCDKSLPQIFGCGNGWNQFDFEVETTNDRGSSFTHASHSHRSETTNISEGFEEKIEEFTGPVGTRENDPTVGGQTCKNFRNKFAVVNRKNLDQGQFQNFRPFVFEQFLQPEILTDRAGDDNTPTKKRTMLEPILLTSKSNRTSYKNDGG